MNNVLNTKVIVFRNLKGYKFSNKLNDQEKQNIAETINEVVKGDMSFINFTQTNETTAKYLKANDLIWETSQNIFAHKKERLAINLFSGEHLAIASTSDGTDKSIFEKALALSDKLSQKIEFAYNDEFGYLMSDLIKIGSGIRVEADIMLSALVAINKIEQVGKNVAKLGYSLKETEFPAVFRLSTKCNLGIGENKIFEDFMSTLNRLQELEIESVKMLQATDADTLIDKVQRSWAVLNSAYLINHDELYNLIVNLRMGLNAGLIDIKVEVLNSLQKLTKEKLNDMISLSEQKEIAQKIKSILKGE